MDGEMSEMVVVFYADDPDDHEWVDEHNACPECGERRMDYLVWQTEYSIEDEGDEVVRCATCGAVYTP